MVTAVTGSLLLHCISCGALVELAEVKGAPGFWLLGSATYLFKSHSRATALKTCDSATDGRREKTRHKLSEEVDKHLSFCREHSHTAYIRPGKSTQYTI